MPVIDQLRKYGETRRGWLGVRIQNVDDQIAESLDLGQTRGAFVSGTDPKGPASAGGIETGDVIVRFDGQDIKESRDAAKIVAQAPVGKDVDVVVMRKGKELSKTVKLGLLDDGEKHAELEKKSRTDAAPVAPAAPVALKALGMTSGISRERPGYSSHQRQCRRRRRHLQRRSGLACRRQAAAARRRGRRNHQEAVKQPSDAADKLQGLKDKGKTSALLLVANAQGEVRFVAVPVN